MIMTRVNKKLKINKVLGMNLRLLDMKIKR